MVAILRDFSEGEAGTIQRYPHSHKQAAQATAGGEEGEEDDVIDAAVNRLSGVFDTALASVKVRSNGSLSIVTLAISLNRGTT